jgi:hypothetical protein
MVRGLQREPSSFWAQDALPKGVHSSSITIAECPVKRGQLHNRYSLGTKNTTLKHNDNGSLTLYAGQTNPDADRESNWLPAPEGPFSLYIRAYWREEPILDGSWQPPKIEKRV